MPNTRNRKGLAKFKAFVITNKGRPRWLTVWNTTAGKTKQRLQAQKNTVICIR
jgi:hypothetical protein